jgi:hypothetical protein
MPINIDDDTTGATSGAGTFNAYEAPAFIPGFLWGSCSVCLGYTIIILNSSMAYAHRKLNKTKSLLRPENFRSDDVNVTTKNTWFSSFFVSSNSLYQGILIRPQSLEYHINREKYTTWQYGKYPHWTGFCRIGPMKVSILY